VRGAVTVRLVCGVLVGLLIAAGSAACGGAGLAPDRAPASSGAGRPAAAIGSLTMADHARACGRSGSAASFSRAAADELMAGRLRIAPFSVVTVDPHHDGDIDWSLDPFHHPTWTTAYQSAGWVGPLIDGALFGGDRAPAYRNRAAALLRDWLHDVPVSRRSPTALVCAVRAFAGESWIEDQIPGQVDYFAAHWDGPWNHGLRRDLEILRIGCGYPASAWGGRPFRWRTVAQRQMVDAFGASGLGQAIDRQGASNEQSTGYTKVTYNWWTRAERQLADCGVPLPAEIGARIANMPTFLAHATQPDGRLVPLGDTYATAPAKVPGTPLLYAATRGAEGSPPPQRVAVYTAGYVFGRSGWGTDRPFGAESFYSLRFGGGRQVHGHNDHMSLTYYARGCNLLVDSGHTGYENSPYRTYLRSPEAHNVLVMPGAPYSVTARTDLTRQAIGPDGQFFEFTDTAYRGRRRTRGVYIDQRPDLVLVFDRAAGAARYQQLWHLDPAFRVTAVRGSYAVATAPGTQLQIRQIPLPGQTIPNGSTQALRGRTDPYQGWVSAAILQRKPAPVVSMTRTGSSTAMLTLIAPADPGAAVTTAVTNRPGGGYRLDVRIGDRSAAFVIGPDGSISRA
jgi:heparinase II/III-like protein